MQTTTPDSLQVARHAAQITGRFRDLQGLRQAAAGAGLLCLAIWELAVPLSRDGIRAANIGLVLGGLAAVVVCFGLAMVGAWRMTVWYRRHYGRVEQTPRQRRLARVIGGTGAFAFLVPFEIEILVMNAGASLPANLNVFTLAIWILGYWIYIGRPFWHYPAMAAVGILLGLVSIGGIPPNTFAWHVREATLYFALATIVGGVIDHMILTRSMSPVSSVGLES